MSYFGAVCAQKSAVLTARFRCFEYSNKVTLWGVLQHGIVSAQV